MQTATQRLADLLLGQPVMEWVDERRAKGLSWRKVAIELRDRTEGEIDVAPATLIAWDAARVAA